MMSSSNLHLFGAVSFLVAKVTPGESKHHLPFQDSSVESPSFLVFLAGNPRTVSHWVNLNHVVALSQSLGLLAGNALIGQA